MKKLIVLLSIPMVLGLGSCQEQKEPVREDFNSWYAPIDGIIEPNCYIKDLDEDGKVDVITNEWDIALFYAESYKNKVNKANVSKVMSPEMREAATNFLKKYNELKYQVAKAEYNFDKNSEDKK